MWGEPTASELEGNRNLQSKNILGKMGSPFPASPFSPGSVDNVMRIPSELLSPGHPREKGKYYTLQTFTRQQANIFLHTGYYKIEKSASIAESQLPGEFVMIYQYNEAGQIDKAVRVDSLSYRHRHQILHPANGLEWNMKARFMTLMSDAVRPERMHLLNDNGSGVRENIRHTPKMDFVHYPLINYQELQALVSQGSAAYYTDLVTQEQEKGAEDAVYNLWLNLLFAAPVSRQSVAFGLLTEYYESIRILTWYMTFFQNSLKELEKNGLGLLVSFIRMALDDKVDLKDNEAVYEWVKVHIFTIPGSVFYTNTKNARQYYNELVLDRTVWLVDAITTDAHKGLFTLEESTEWVRDAFRTEGRTDKEVESIVVVFERYITYITGVLLENSGSFSNGYSEARDALRMAILQETLFDSLWFTEALDFVYERGMELLVDSYRELITPTFFEKLSEENPALYELFVQLQATLEASLSDSKFDTSLITSKDAPQQVIDHMRNVFQDFQVTETTRIQRGLLNVSA